MHELNIDELMSLTAGRQMYEANKLYCEKLSFVFLISDNESFITSDNPCFTFTKREGYKEPVFITRPNFAISLAKKDSGEPRAYRILNLRTEDVIYYNKIVFENGNLILSK